MVGGWLTVGFNVRDTICMDLRAFELYMSKRLFTCLEYHFSSTSEQSAPAIDTLP